VFPKCNKARSEINAKLNGLCVLTVRTTSDIPAGECSQQIIDTISIPVLSHSQLYLHGFLAVRQAVKSDYSGRAGKLLDLHQVGLEHSAVTWFIQANPRIIITTHRYYNVNSIYYYYYYYYYY
jgi:hypothetical protein